MVYLKQMLNDFIAILDHKPVYNSYQSRTQQKFQSEPLIAKIIC